MRSIYFLLISKLAKDLGILAVCSILFIGACQGLGFNLRWLPPILVVTAVCLSLMVGPSSFSKTPWLFNVPFKRNQLILLSAFINITYALIVLVWFNATDAFVSLLGTGNFKQFISDLTQANKEFFPITYDSLHDLVFGGLVCINFILVAWLLAGPIFLRLRSRNMLFPPRTNFGAVDVKKRRRNLAIIFFAFLLLISLKQYLWFGLSISILTLWAFTYFPVSLFAHLSGLFGSTEKQWKALAAAIFIFEVILMCGSTFSDLHSPVLAYQIDANLFLGSWSNTDKQTLSRFLVSDIPPGEIRKLGEKYRALYADNNSSGLSGKEGLLLSEVIQNKKNPLINFTRH